MRGSSLIPRVDLISFAIVYKERYKTSFYREKKKKKKNLISIPLFKHRFRIDFLTFQEKMEGMASHS